MNLATQRALLTVVVLTTLAIYWPGLNGPLILDDVPNLLPLKLLAEQGALTFERVMAERASGVDGRPLAMLSFLTNWRLGGDSVWWLKATNLSIHLLAGVLCFVLARQLLETSLALDASRAEWLALWLAAAWLLAPWQVSTVLYVIQRMAALSAVLGLVGLVAWLWARRIQSRRPFAAAALMASVLVVWLPLAVASKQTGALLPFLIVVIEVWFVPRPALPPLPKPARVALALACVAPIAALVLRFARNPSWLSDAYALRDFTLGERLLTGPRVLFDYAASVFQIPWASPLGLFRDDVLVSTSFLTPPSTLLAALALLALAVLATRYVGHRLSPIFGGLVFFVVGHSLEASFPAIEPYFEHRNYLPSFGLLIGFVAAVSLALDRQLLRRGIAVMLLGAVGLYTGMTALRVDIWRSWPGIVQNNLEAHPMSPRAQAARAILAIEAKELAEANDALDRVLELGGPKRRFGVALKRVLAHCVADTQPPQALYHELQTAAPIQDDPYTVAALSWLRETVTSQRCDAKIDVPRLARIVDDVVTASAVTLKFNHSWTLHRDAGELLLASGERARARHHLLMAIVQAPASRRAALAQRLRESVTHAG